jgi:hypothetical protein
MVPDELFFGSAFCHERRLVELPKSFEWRSRHHPITQSEPAQSPGRIFAHSPVLLDTLIYQTAEVVVINQSQDMLVIWRCVISGNCNQGG